MKQVRCEQCGELYTVAPLQSAWDALLAERRFFDVAPELRERRTCPKCGHWQASAQYKFFGLLSTRGMYVVMALILLAMLALGFVFGD